MSATRTAQLSALGVSIWLDDLSRERIRSGELAALISSRDVVGVTTNPTIFATAVAGSDSYRDAIAALAATGASVEGAVLEITTADVAAAADVFVDVFERSGGVDGRVSIEVPPGLAYDAAGTVTAAEELSAKVDRPNILVKIPATAEGLVAITDTIARGISVNVTLIFALDRYREVVDAYLTGLERARAGGIDLSTIHSVASFFVSRVDTEVDKRLEVIGTDDAAALRSRAGVANARLAYELFEQEFATPRARALLVAGANLQRPLWASTGVKDPALPHTLYVTELAVGGTVNTMPEKTLEATFDHAELHGDAVTGEYADAHAVLDGLATLGIDYDDVTATLEREGVDKFIASWEDLLNTVQTALDAAR